MSMTDKQKLQSLFDAALKSSADFNRGSLQQAFPVAAVAATAMVADDCHAPAVAPPLEPLNSSASSGTNAPIPAAAAPAPGLDASASKELGVLLDDQIRRRKRRHRIEALVTAVVFLGSAAGGTLWFVQDGSRVQAFKEAMRDIRSVGDVKSLVAKYQESLDRIAARGRQIDQATAAMGVKPTDGTEDDPYFDAEMKQMMGKDGGKTFGQRNRALQKNFAHMARENGGTLQARPEAVQGQDAPPAFEFN